MSLLDKAKALAKAFYNSIYKEILCLLILIVNISMSIVSFAQLMESEYFEASINKTIENRTTRYIILAKQNVDVDLIDLTKCTNFYRKESTLSTFNLLFKGDNFVYVVAQASFFFSIGFCFSMQMFRIRQKRLNKEIKKNLTILDYAVKIFYIPGTFVFSLINYNQNCVELKYSSFILNLVSYGNICLLPTLAFGAYFFICSFGQKSDDSDDKHTNSCIAGLFFFCAFIMVVSSLILYVVSFIGPIVAAAKSVLVTLNMFLTIHNCSTIKCCCCH